MFVGQNTWFYSSVGEVDTKPNIRGVIYKTFSLHILHHLKMPTVLLLEIELS
jgi:hypothetical protein